jgi:riboflavin biosynthesis pyrimidine reductase
MASKVLWHVTMSLDGFASIARQCLEHRLLDEIVVHLAPVLLGEGVRLYEGAGVGQIPPERIAVSESEQITDLRVRVLR